MRSRLSGGRSRANWASWEDIHLRPRGVHVELRFGELRHEAVLGQRRLVILDELFHSEVGLLQCLHVKLFRALRSHGRREEVVLPCLLQGRGPQ